MKETRNQRCLVPIPARYETAAAAAAASSAAAAALRWDEDISQKT